MFGLDRSDSPFPRRLHQDMLRPPRCDPLESPGRFLKFRADRRLKSRGLNLLLENTSLRECQARPLSIIM